MNVLVWSEGSEISSGVPSLHLSHPELDLQHVLLRFGGTFKPVSTPTIGSSGFLRCDLWLCRRYSRLVVSKGVQSRVERNGLPRVSSEDVDYVTRGSLVEEGHVSNRDRSKGTPIRVGGRGGPCMETH